jgi:hypothetical protein
MKSVSGIRVSPLLDFMVCKVSEWKGDVWRVKDLDLFAPEAPD